MTELDPHDLDRDRELAEALRQTLEQTASRPDPLMDAALAATRAQIAAQPRKHSRHSSWWVAGGFVVAACLAVVLVMPFGQTPAGQAVVPVVAVGAMPDADLQLLEDMDMLTAMSNES